MDGGDFASILAAVVAAISAYAVARSASKANQITKQIESQAAIEAKRLEMEGARESTRATVESEAYERARAFDVATIERQTAEILQVRADNVHLNADVKRVNRENEELHSDREHLRSEIRTLNEERDREREECRRVRQRLAQAVADGRMDPLGAIEVDTHAPSNHRAPIEFDTHDRDIDFSEHRDQEHTD